VGTSLISTQRGAVWKSARADTARAYPGTVPANGAVDLAAHG
jgi:hypothetical protein